MSARCVGLVRSVFYWCNYAANESISSLGHQVPSLNRAHLSWQRYTRRYCERTGISRTFQSGLVRHLDLAMQPFAEAHTAPQGTRSTQEHVR